MEMAYWPEFSLRMANLHKSHRGGYGEHQEWNQRGAGGSGKYGKRPRCRAMSAVTGA